MTRSATILATLALAAGLGSVTSAQAPESSPSSVGAIQAAPHESEWRDRQTRIKKAEAEHVNERAAHKAEWHEHEARGAQIDAKHAKEQAARKAAWRERQARKAGPTKRSS